MPNLTLCVQYKGNISSRFSSNWTVLDCMDHGLYRICHKKSLSLMLTFISGRVEPPKNTRVNNTMMSVVVTITCRVVSLKSKCNERANAIAPRRPEIIILNMRAKKIFLQYFFKILKDTLQNFKIS